MKKVVQHVTLKVANSDSRPGNWIGKVPIPEKSLESSEARLEGEEKKLFLNFIRGMLQWNPEDRSAIQDMFTDEWFCDDLLRSGKAVRKKQDA